jgi:hypothetical protein
LINQFAVKVDQRKKALEERLRRKKESKSDNIFDGEEDEEGSLAMLERTFEDVVNMVKTLDTKQLKQVQVDSLVGAIEKMMKVYNFHVFIHLLLIYICKLQGEVVSSLTLTLPGVLQSPLGGYRNEKKPLSYVDDDQSSLKEEVKRISTVYGEEKQKLDLMMKLQQTRQRQALQRKLLLRKQAEGSAEGQQQTPLPVVGSRRTEAPIPYGGARVTNQPSFRGLGDLGVSGFGEAKVASSSSISPPASMASRGLSLSNITRK